MESLMNANPLDTRVTFLIPKGLQSRSLLAAEDEGMTMSEFVRHAVRAELLKLDIGKRKQS
jgi:hypothetical protein